MLWSIFKRCFTFFKETWILGIIFILSFNLNYQYIFYEKDLLGGDPLLVYIQSLAFHHLFPSPAAWLVSEHRPPLIYFTNLFFYHYLGLSYQTALININAYLLPLILALYYLGKYWGGRSLGLIFALLGGMSPLLLAHAKLYTSDFPLLVMVSASLTFLLYSDNFKKLFPSLGFGVCLGLGMLTKYSCVHFLLLPCAYYTLTIIYKSLKSLSLRWALLLAWLVPVGLLTILIINPSFSDLNSPYHRYKDQIIIIFYLLMGLLLGVLLLLKLKGTKLTSSRFLSLDYLPNFINLNLALIAGMLLAFPWYFRSVQSLSTNLSFQAYESLIHPFDFKLTCLRYLFYLEHAYAYALIALSLGLIYLLTIYRKKGELWLIFCSSLFSFFSLTVTIAAEPRHLIPIFPFFLVLSGVWLKELKFKPLVVFAVLCLALFQLYGGELKERKFPALKNYPFSGFQVKSSWNYPRMVSSYQEVLQGLVYLPFYNRPEHNLSATYLENNFLKPLQVIQALSQNQPVKVSVLWDYYTSRCGIMPFPDFQRFILEYNFPIKINNRDNLTPAEAAQLNYLLVLSLNQAQQLSKIKTFEAQYGVRLKLLKNFIAYKVFADRAIRGEDADNLWIGLYQVQPHSCK
jgi:4-amino-4-deoxy-L-arabinose transferase-like glycosyltransferase